MNKLLIKTGSTETFFKRGRDIAKKADARGPLTDEKIISFEDPSELVRLMTDARLAVFREVKHSAGSITDIAERLHRDRSAVKRDIDALALAGLLNVQDCVLPGHGRMKWVEAVAQRLSLRAELA
ncbi:HVO_A0114 family putative DNA-binding protein [Limnobacter sp.]|uniref:HVO_A0114 family putative DNA-binding protein n=1 Tax=Limnobacter sp. TaxID=2003368 RepID=UPI002FE26E32